LSVRVSMDVFPLGLVLGCLFDKERSANMTMLPDDDDQMITALTQPRFLIDRITCNSLSTCCESVRSLCVLDADRRGKLSEVLMSLGKLRRTGL
jgi:hypothetical protein